MKINWNSLLKLLNWINILVCWFWFFGLKLFIWIFVVFVVSWVVKLIVEINLVNCDMLFCWKCICGGLVILEMSEWNCLGLKCK